jgi:predicted nucleic acid-binding protein
MTLVIDSSAVTAALVDSGPTGVWADEHLASRDLAAPHLMPVEVSNILRRSAASGAISADAATLAHADLLRLRVALYPFEPFAQRVWALRANVTAYDAWHVALAEHLGAQCVTLDHRLARAAGPRCEFLTP